MSEEQSAEQWAWEAFCTAHPHEAFAANPEKFWQFFNAEHPAVSREIMERTLKETE